MSISVGDKIPAGTLQIMGENGPTPISSDQIFFGKKVVLFAVPGAFTPGCSMTHLPGYVANADKILDAGVDTIACLSVNDAFVMDAWGKTQNAEKIMMLADGNGDFTRSLDLELDGRGFGMGLRSQRYAMIVDDGEVTHINVEEGAGVDVSSAENILEAL